MGEVFVTYKIERIFYWCFISHWSEEVGLQAEDHSLLLNFISHQELLACSRNVSVVMLDSHSGESSLLDLSGNIFGQIESDLSFLRWMNTWVGGSSPDVESLITEFIDHFKSFIIC